MTTHYQKIQALGNKMVSNLESMGVSANFNDGGMTLADKILEIQHFDNGLKLYADKNIGQIGDEINLYALVLKDNIAQSGKTILFKGLVNSTGTTKTVTGNNGIANVTYTCSGVGDKNIQAIYQSSDSILSSTMSITVVNPVVLYQPALDGTESFTQVSGTTTIANGEMYGGVSFLNNGWDNSSDWKLTFQYKAQYGTSMLIAPLGQTLVEYNGLQLKNYDDNEISVWVNGRDNTYSVDANAYPNDTYVPVTIVKNSSTFTITINNYTYTVTWDNSSYSNLCIGVYSWEKGYSSYVKDIKVVRL